MAVVVKCWNVAMGGGGYGVSRDEMSHAQMKEICTSHFYVKIEGYVDQGRN